MLGPARRLSNSPTAPRQVLIGTYTERLPHAVGKGEGIMLSTFADGRLSPPSLVVTIGYPAYITSVASGDRVYAASETFEFEDKPGGALTSFARDLRTGALRLLNTKLSGGDEPCYIATDASGDFALVAN